MADLDDLINQIPVADIAKKLGANEGEVNNAVRTLVPALVGGIQQNVQTDDIDSSELESAVTRQGASDLLDGGVSVDQVDDARPSSARSHGSSAATTPRRWPSALSGAGAGNSDSDQKLLPILMPIVLAYIGKRLTRAGLPARTAGSAVRRRARRHPGQHPRRRVAEERQPARRHPGQCARRDKGGSIGDILGGLIRGGK